MLRFTRQVSEVPHPGIVNSAVSTSQALSLLTSAQIFPEGEKKKLPGKKSSLLGCGRGWADLRENKACLAHSKILLSIPTPLHFLKEEIRKSIKA